MTGMNTLVIIDFLKNFVLYETVRSNTDITKTLDGFDLIISLKNIKHLVPKFIDEHYSIIKISYSLKILTIEFGHSVFDDTNIFRFLTMDRGLIRSVHFAKGN